LEKVILTDAVIEYLDQLVYSLFVDEYFSYRESAQFYVDKIMDFIFVEIFSFPHKTTPKSLQYFGSFYVFYKANTRTTWYVFFEKQDDKFLITGILNNHCKEANEL
jgi:hypothetical protein